MKKLLTTSFNSDVVCIIQDSKEKMNKRFHLHKVILSSQCEWFQGLFSHNWKENTSNTYSISDISFEAFSCLVEYIYTEDVTLSHTLVAEVLVLADKFNLQRLKQKCELYLSNSLDVENVLDIYFASKLYQAPQLQSICFFLLSNPEWYLQLKNHKLFSQIERKDLQKLESEFHVKKEIIDKKEFLTQQLKECQRKQKLYNI